MKSFDRSEIENLFLFDANCHLGPSNVSVAAAPISAVQVKGELDRCGIAEALVYHSFAGGYSPSIGNAILSAEISAIPRFHGVWVVLPHHTEEMPAPGLLVEKTLAIDIRAVRMFPVRHRFLLSDWSVDKLLEKLSEHRLPLFLDYDRTHWSEDIVDYDAVCRICKQFPTLPLILVREGIGSARYLYPLLERFDNLHLETSYYQAPCGLEDISRKFGAKHLLFGTGLPIYEAGPAISMLLCSEISPEEKQMVAGGNLRSLLDSVQA